MKGIAIGCYTPVSDFTTAGSGSATWCFATDSAGHEVFLKKFLSPVCPDPSISLPERVRKGRIATCQRFYNRKKAVYDAVRRAANNNIIVPHEIFQHDGHYYVVSDRVRMEDMSIERVCRLPRGNVVMLLRVMAHCLMQLEAQGVVHADLKPDNFLIKRTESGHYTLKLIDFDASYLVSDPPAPGEEIQCDAVYVAPETMQFMMEEPASLTSKADVFAFAIIMHQMLTGHLPAFDSRYDSVCHAVLEGGRIGVDSAIPEPYRTLIIRSLDRDPAGRPTSKAIQEALLAASSGLGGEPAPDTAGPASDATASAGSASTASASAGSSPAESASAGPRVYISPSLRPRAGEPEPPERGKHMKPLRGF